LQSAGPRRATGPHGTTGEGAIASKLAALTLVLALAAAAFTIYSQHRFRQLSEALDTQIATFKRQRWERPTLRGQPTEGNAALEALVALKDFAGLDPKQRDALAAELFYGQPLSAAHLELLGKHALMLSKLRDATQLGWATTEIAVEQGESASPPPYPRVMDAVLLMLAQAARSGADDCLMIGTDVLRLGQDLVPGAPLEAASVSMRVTSVATPVLTRCATEASAEALPRAARELNTLATHPPPTGGGIELADILAQVKLRRLAELFPKDGDDSLLTRLRRRPVLFEAFAHFENPTRWRELTPDRYPQALETWQREYDWRSRSQLPLVADASANVQGWLYDDMRGQALLRSLTVGFATLAERARQKRTPREPVSLGDASLRDPFNGQPLKWRMSQEGRELSIWSVGEDRRDDKGSSDWAAQAPLDVVVHFRLRPFEDSEPPRHAGRH
jgi:hypothetical protein